MAYLFPFLNRRLSFGSFLSANPNMAEARSFGLRGAGIGLLVFFIFSPLVVTGQTAVFKKINFFTVSGDKEKKFRARVVIDPESKTLQISGEKNGIPEYATIPFDNITKIVYERSAHRRYKAGLLFSPWLLFSKGKKHWATIEFENVPEHPIGNVYFRMHKGNYRRILASLQSATGVEVEEFIEK